MKTVALATFQRKGVINIPAEIRTQAGLVKGDMLEVKFKNGRIILVPKTVTNRMAIARGGRREAASKKPVAKKKRAAR